jgi:DNA-binding NarL/FixJ family response regulator
MAPELPESFEQRIKSLRERNEQIRRTLDREFLRFTALRAARGPRKAASGPISSLLDELTPREREVLRCIAEGASTKETAARLGMSFKTAACHRHRIMQKLGVHGTGALVRFAIANNVVSLPIER